MDVAPEAPVVATSPAAASSSETLDGGATAFARMPPRQKAALLRACIPSILAAGPALVSASCARADTDPTTPLVGAAWLAGPVALVANARRFAEALEDVASSGRPSLSLRDLRGRLDGRVVARLEARTFAERVHHRNAEAVAVFAEGVEPEEALLAQATFYRETAPVGGEELVRDARSALDALFVRGRVTTLETEDPAIAAALAPLCEAGALRVVSSPARARVAADAAAIVAPAFYSKAELGFIARRLASEIGAGAAFDLPAPRTIIVAGCWAQRAMFVEALQGALAALPSHVAPRRLVADAAPDPHEVAVVGVGCDEPVDMLPAAVDRCNMLGATSVEIVVHIVQEEDPAVAAALDRALVRLDATVVGVNQWPELLAFRGDAPSGPRMLGRVAKGIIRGQLAPSRRPLYVLDHPSAARAGARLAALYAAPGVGGLLRIS